ncbi:hypothetical protein HT031_000147 [Scenedesmus sp. PABB004]|nr:hypothetical protein HT031_000147 [Scenedesmus sp. PABB004]
MLLLLSRAARGAAALTQQAPLAGALSHASRLLASAPGAACSTRASHEPEAKASIRAHKAGRLLAESRIGVQGQESSWGGRSGGSWAVAAQQQQRGVSTSAPAAHGGCGHDHAKAPEPNLYSQHADLPALTAAVAAAGDGLDAAHVADALARCAALAVGQPAGASAPLLAQLAPAWLAALPGAHVQALGRALLSFVKLGVRDGALWGPTLAAVTAPVCKEAGGKDLHSIAFAIGYMAETGEGAVPGAPRAAVEAALTAVTQQLVVMVTAPPPGATRRAAPRPPRRTAMTTTTTTARVTTPATRTATATTTTRA